MDYEQLKAYTNLEQSKKLVEILPLESADGGWYGTENPLAPNITFWLHTKYTNKAELPAWSLASLLEVIPKEIFDGEYVINITVGVYNRWIITYDTFNSGSFYGLVACAYNLIDACVDIIEKLHKRNLL